MIVEVTGRYNAEEVEGEIEDFWKRSEIYDKTRTMRVGKEKFFFVDGPPYTTGRIHLGTAWNKVIKDAILRYRSMSGFHVRDRAGWDMHGLPIEVKVEESLGFKSKKDIESYGVDNFVRRCMEFATGHKDEMTKQFESLGIWLNWKDPYMTLRNEYIEAAWWTLKRGHERGLLERGFRVVNWCPRCETAIADSEVEYWDEEDPSIYVKFPVIGEDNTCIVIWTTTPWTIPANIAVAVHPSFEYSKVLARKDEEEDILILATELVESVLKEGRYKDYELLEKFLGEELVGLEYTHPLDDLIPVQLKTAHRVYMADFVTAEKTGCVHIAPGHGIEDFELGLKEKLPIFCPVGEDGKFTADAGEKYSGKYVKDADQEVIEDLRERGVLLARGRLVHRYGHCWRCKTPIIYIATSQWFLKVSDLRDSMLDAIGNVIWYPEWAGSSRFRDWISGARDWCISRQRYWGIPLPIWICEMCGSVEVMGTMEELEKRSKEKIRDLHRPAVDGVFFECGCKGRMSRVPDVFDVWFDSAVASWATLGYPEELEQFEDWWPADFITEGHDQTRGWFYSQLGASMVAFGMAPYKSVLMHGFALDESGRKMSKSLGNVVSPGDVISKYGADTLRFYVLSSNAPWEDLHFSWEVAENVNRMLNILWNVYRFPLPYMLLDKFDITKTRLDRNSLRPEDKWILSRVNSLAREVQNYTDIYQLHRTTRALASFILEDLSRWYIQLVRPRTWTETDDPDKLAAYATIYEVMATLIKLMAPFTPYLAESIYQNLVKGMDPEAPESVHMCDWPSPREDLIDGSLEEMMQTVRDISESVANARQKAGRKLRWPVSEIIIAPDKEIDISGLEGVLLSQTNSKKITVLNPGGKPEMVLELQPVPRRIGPVFKGEAQLVIEALKKSDPVEMKRSLEAGGYALNVDGKTYQIASDMVEFREILPEKLWATKFSSGAVYVDVELTSELEREGYAREMIRRIQDMRKELDLRVEDKIEVAAKVTDQEVSALMLKLKDYIKGEVRASKLEIGDDISVRGSLIKEWKVEDTLMLVGIGVSRTGGEPE